MTNAPVEVGRNIKNVMEKDKSCYSWDCWRIKRKDLTNTKKYDINRLLEFIITTRSNKNDSHYYCYHVCSGHSNLFS